MVFDLKMFHLLHFQHNFPYKFKTVTLKYILMLNIRYIRENLRSNFSGVLLRRAIDNTLKNLQENIRVEVEIKPNRLTDIYFTTCSQIFTKIFRTSLVKFPVSSF